MVEGIDVEGMCQYGSLSVSQVFREAPIAIGLGEDAVLGCRLEMNYQELKNFCAAGTTVKMLTPAPSVTGDSGAITPYSFPFSHVGKWGASDSSNQDDHIAITGAGEGPPEGNAPDFECETTVGTEFEILYSYHGEF